MRKAKALFKSWVTRGNSSQSSPSSMKSGEIEYMKSLNESNRQSSGFHATNPFASDVEELSRLSARAEIAADDMIANMFLYDVMSDNVSIADQNSQMAYFSQLNSSRASSDSANFINGTTMNCGNVWPPMNNSAIGWGDWPNSNGEQATSSDISKWVENMNAGTAFGAITPQMSLDVDPLGSGVPVFAASRNAVANKTEGRINQDKMETTMASVKSLTEKLISEMTAIMAQRDQQADERLTLISETMHRRDIDVNKRMVDLMTTIQELTLGVKAVMATVPSRPSPVPVALNPAKVHPLMNLQFSNPPIEK